MEQIKKFIKENKITFSAGHRNHDSTILSGFALHIKSDIDIHTLVKVTEESLPEVKIHDYSGELVRVFKYAKTNNYGKFWDTEEAKRLYKF